MSTILDGRKIAGDIKEEIKAKHLKNRDRLIAEGVVTL